MKFNFLHFMMGLTLPWFMMNSAFAAWSPQAKEAVNRFLASHPSL
jgi:hypothetical protein